MNTIRDAVRKLRTEQNLTQVELANISGVSRRQIQRIELGEALPSEDTAVKLLRPLVLQTNEAIINVKSKTLVVAAAR